MITPEQYAKWRRERVALLPVLSKVVITLDNPEVFMRHASVVDNSAAFVKVRLEDGRTAQVWWEHLMPEAQAAEIFSNAIKEQRDA